MNYQLHIVPAPTPRFIVGIFPDGVEDAQCIRVAHPSGMYLTDDFIPTHNSSDAESATPLTRDALYDMVIKAHYGSLDTANKVLEFAHAARDALVSLGRFKTANLSYKEWQLRDKLEEMFDTRSTGVEEDWETFFDGLDASDAERAQLNAIVAEAKKTYAQSHDTAPESEASPTRLRLENWALSLLQRGVPTIKVQVQRMNAEQLQYFDDLLDAMYPPRAESRFWKRHPLPADAEALERLKNHLEAAVDAATERREALEKDSGVRYSKQAASPPARQAKVNSGLLAWVKSAGSGRVGREQGVAEAVLLFEKPPGVLETIGLKRPITLDFEHVRHILQTHPEIRAEDIAALPDLLTRPRLATQKISEAGRKTGVDEGVGWRLVLDSRTENGNPLVVALTHTKSKGVEQIKITEVNTLYGLRDSASEVAKDLLSGRGLWIDEKELARLGALLALRPRGSIPLNATQGGAGTQVRPQSGWDLKPQPQFRSEHRTGQRPKPTQLPSERAITLNSQSGKVNLTIPTDAPQRLKGLQFSQQTANPRTQQASQEEVDAAMQHLVDTLGDSIRAETKKWFADNASGRWTKRRTKNLIELALNGRVLETAYHESLHEFFDQLEKHGAENVKALLQRVATNKIILRQLYKLLANDEAAIAQLSDPAEAAAYMYQFHQAGLLKIGPQTRSFFQRIADTFRRLFHLVQPEIRDFAQAELILRAFSKGAIKESAARKAAIEKMQKDVTLHDAAGRSAGRLVTIVGNKLFSAEAAMENTGNPYIVAIARRANQKAGSKMGSQAYFDARHQQRGIWLNRLEDILNLSGGDKDVLALARESLNTGKVTHHPEAKALVEALRGFLKEMYDYAAERGVRRWDPDKIHPRWKTAGAWVKVPYRENYFPQVWSADALTSRGEAFVQALLKHNTPELNAIARAANDEIAALENAKDASEAFAARRALGDAARKAADEGGVVTAQDVAEAILTRLTRANGFADLSETTSDLGMTPLASMVNRRELDWIDPRNYDAFMEPDLVKIMTTYAQSLVNRAEYSNAFGPGGEMLSENMHKALLFEMGGEELVAHAERSLKFYVTAWKKRKAKAIQEGKVFNEAFPTLRVVGMDAHADAVGREQATQDMRKAVDKLEPSTRAVMAVEGTLGHDISPRLRSLNNALVTYQSLRLMSLGLFSSFSDMMGIVVNGGALGDAFDAFVRAMREIKLHWGKDKSRDALARRAEVWGTVEATAALDALGQTFGSMYLTGRAKRYNAAFFRLNGMEAWNRAMRTTATSVAERVIRAYREEGVDRKDAAAAARFARLFGEGFKPSDIKLDADGMLDASDARNQAAVMRWVSDAIMLPNATHRTIWASDPHFAVFWQFKQFAYTLHRVMLKGVVEQAKLGNYRPAVALLVGYTPVMIAADAVKELMVPGDEPPWMKQGLGAFIEHGLERAGVFGVPQLFYESLGPSAWKRGKPVVGLLGPSVSQIVDGIADPAERTILGALPLGSIARRYAD